MEIKELMNSSGLWLASIPIVVVIISLSSIYFRMAIRRAKEIGISKQRYIPAIRSAAITSLGPSLSPVIVLLSMIAIMGSPTSWMRLNMVGAARTELAMVTMSSGLLGIEPGNAAFGAQAFSYAVWGVALNDVGWFVVALLMTHRMGNAVSCLNQKFDRKWINMLMAGATLGVTGYLLANQIMSKLLVDNVSILLRMKGLLPALIAGTVMVIINRFFVKYQRLQELALGIAMLTGMFVTQFIYQ